MTRKNTPERDAFAFSLGGMTTITSVVIAPAVADDRINKALDERMNKTDAEPDADQIMTTRWGRFWLRRRHQPV